MVKNPPAMQEIWIQSLGWEDSLEKGMAPVTLPGKFHGILVGYCSWSFKESDTTERLTLFHTFQQ